jgi:hypothetical protein
MERKKYMFILKSSLAQLRQQLREQFRKELWQTGKKKQLPRGCGRKSHSLESFGREGAEKSSLLLSPSLPQLPPFCSIALGGGPLVKTRPTRLEVVA